jgi:penicillin-binding protein 1C
MRFLPNNLFFRRRTACAMVIAGLAAMALSALLVHSICVRRWRFDENSLLAQRPSCVFTDRHGMVLRAELGDHDVWQVPVPLTDVSPQVAQAIVAVEDQRFWRHQGVDWLAVARAFFSNVRHGRIVSGASTLSMQLSRMANPEPRSYATKLRQTFKARDLERRHDKQWILENYLNRAPYGGNLVGIEAAARCYFHKPASELSFDEATLLAGLPQRPSSLRPDRHPQAARERQKHVIQCMLENGMLATQRLRETEDCQLPAIQPSGVAADGTLSESESEPQRRDCGDGAAPGLASASARQQSDPIPKSLIKSRNRLGFPMTERHFCDLAARESSASRVRTTLDPRLQSLTRQALRAQVETLAGVADGAAVIIENRTGAVRSLIGTLDFDALENGQVNAACARRSPGSALKPFIYLLALEGGLIVPETLLDDQPLVLKDYRPNNFDGNFSGTVSAREALTRSLNTPAVRLLSSIGPDYLLTSLRRCGIRSLDRGAEYYGLSLALGGGEVTLLELTNAYAGLARGGAFAPCHFTEKSETRFRTMQSGEELEGDVACLPTSLQITHGSVALLADMLSTYPLPGCPAIPLAWKTGTSNGFRDAWCLGFNAEYTVGVWVGNKSGKAAAALVGLNAAAPALAGILQSIYRDRQPPPVQETLDGVVPVTLCAESGLRAGPQCRQQTLKLAVQGIPLRICGLPHRWMQAGEHVTSVLEHREAATPATKPRILTPEPRTYLREVSGPNIALHLSTVADRECSWFIDGRYDGKHRTPFSRSFDSGTHQITCVCTATGLADNVTISVK